MICRYCGSARINLSSLRNHERVCKNNPNRQVVKTNTAAYYEALKTRTKKRSNASIKAKELDHTYTVSDSTRTKLRNANLGKAWTNEMREKHSLAMLEAVKNHPDSYSKSNVSGRVKLFEYGGTTLKGGWELLVAQWLDSNNVKWTNDIEPINYTFDGKDRLYFPDFYLPQYDIYIEVKGYKRDIDEAKWVSVTKPIVIIDKTTIHNLSELSIKYFIENKIWN